MMQEHQKNQGNRRRLPLDRRNMSKETKDRLALRMSAETKEKIERWYRKDGCRSRNEFVEKAVNYYADALAAGTNTALPREIVAAIDGRLGMFEDRMAALLYKLSVEVDMVGTLNAHTYEIDADSLRRLRADSVRNVKQTNGRISFEQHVRETEGGA